MIANDCKDDYSTQEIMFHTDTKGDLEAIQWWNFNGWNNIFVLVKWHPKIWWNHILAGIPRKEWKCMKVSVAWMSQELSN